MNTMRVWVIVAAATLVVCCGPGLALARGGARTDQGRLASSAVRVSMDQAVQLVERRYKARVVRAETRKSDGRTVYVLRLLDQSGRVFTVRVDASSGAIL